MYKLVLLICLSGMTAISLASPHLKSTHTYGTLIQSPDEKTVYSEVVDCGSVSQLDVFRRARLWILQSVPNDKLLLNDKETGDLVSYTTFNFALPRNESFSGGLYTVSYVLTIECANRKYRSSISHIEVLQGGSGKSTLFDSFRLQSEAATKQFQTEMDRLLKTKMEELKRHVKDYKSF